MLNQNQIDLGASCMVLCVFFIISCIYNLYFYLRFCVPYMRYSFLCKNLRATIESADSVDKLIFILDSIQQYWLQIYSEYILLNAVKLVKDSEILKGLNMWACNAQLEMEHLKSHSDSINYAKMRVENFLKLKELEWPKLCYAGAFFKISGLAYLICLALYLAQDLF